MEVESISPVLILLGPIFVTELPSVRLESPPLHLLSELSVSGLSYTLEVADVATTELGLVECPASVEAVAEHG